jgi:hypothetical protein
VHVVQHDRARGSQAGADQGADARRGIKVGVEQPDDRQAGLGAQHGRTAVAQIGGGAGRDQVSG